MEYQINDQFCLINFGAELDAALLPQLKDVLTQTLKEQKNIIFIANELNKIDSASLQLILIFTQTLTQRDLQWQWQEPTEVVMQAAAVLGMKKLLKLDVEANSDAH